MPEEKTETPGVLPESTPPPRYLMTDYSFTLQAVMELQKAVGQLTERINVLVGRVDSQGETLNSVSRNIYAGWIVLVIFLAVGGFLLDKLWPGITKMLEQVLRYSSSAAK